MTERGFIHATLWQDGVRTDLRHALPEAPIAGPSPSMPTARSSGPHALPQEGSRRTLARRSPGRSGRTGGRGEPGSRPRHSGSRDRLVRNRPQDPPGGALAGRPPDRPQHPDRRRYRLDVERSRRDQCAGQIVGVGRYRGQDRAFLLQPGGRQACRIPAVGAWPDLACQHGSCRPSRRHSALHCYCVAVGGRPTSRAGR